ncbi:MAG: AAA family ATPase, partial [Gammaproteobacteria bacterium]|nr:AAA family ATPase [Gammaproteobacteria bacterium]
MFIPNPFIHGDPVPKEHFLGRQKESRRVVSRIISQAQSTAVIGEPRSGKTSLLKYLFDPAMRSALYGTEGERLLFSFVDIQNNLSGTFKRAQFWMQALSPLHARVKKLAPRSPLRIAYKTCMDKKFSAGALESLFEKLRESGQCLVLLLDEFDALLSHPALNNAEFFGGLRSLASRMEALSLVIASRRPLARLNEATQEFNPTGSPFFNFISSEISLGPLEEKDVLQLLSKAKGRFTP